MIKVDIKDVINAHVRIKPYILETPLIYAEFLSRKKGADIWFKMESFQKTGSFKFRGAINNIFSLPKSDLEKGVITVSSGNHALAVSYAARLKGIKATVCLPESSPRTKREGIESLGAELIVHGPTYVEAEEKAREIAKITGGKFIHSYEDPETIAGQGTCALEALLKEGSFDIILVPTGGGGLLCGTAITAKALSPGVRVYGIQTDTSAPWYSSFYNKKLDNNYSFSATCADGLEGEIGWPTVELALKHVDGIIVVKEEETRRGIRWIADKHHFMIEGAAATCLAAIFEDKLDFAGKKVLCLITGGNIDLDRFCEITTNNFKNEGELK